MNTYIQKIMSSATPQQLMQLYSARTDEEVNNLFSILYHNPHSVHLV